jgi:2-polyprenyl-3-methyl-5-hydroxy-6-metoxy-1,4-benzoquinol methylase
MGKPYETELDLSELNDSRTKQILMIGEGKRVIEFGCSTGYISRILKQRGCYVVGIEIDPEAAEKAMQVCDRVVVGDLDQLDVAGELGGETFEVGLFGDVIEHLRFPQRLLVQARGLLVPGGYIVISVPNIAHASIRLMLLKGEFSYEEFGILDDTHLKYFTRKSIEDLLESCGYVVEETDWTKQAVAETELRETLDPLGLSNLEEVVKAFSTPDAVAFQYVIKASPADEAALIERLSEEKVDAERRARVLERNMYNYEELARYSKELESMIEKKDEYIGMLEGEVLVRDREKQEKDQDAQSKRSHEGFLKRG